MQIDLSDDKKVKLTTNKKYGKFSPFLSFPLICRMSSRFRDHMHGIHPINHPSDEPNPQNSNIGVQEAAVPGAALHTIVPISAGLIILTVLFVLIYIKREKSSLRRFVNIMHLYQINEHSEIVISLYYYD